MIKPILFSLLVLLMIVPVSSFATDHDVYYEVKDKIIDGKRIWKELEILKQNTDEDNTQKIIELEEEFQKILKYLNHNGVGIADPVNNNPDYWINSNIPPEPEYAKEYPIIIFHKYLDEFNYPDPKNEWYYNMTFTQNSTDVVIVKFPNTLAMMKNIDFNNNWGVFGYTNPSDTTEYFGACYRTHVIESDFEYSVLELGGGSVAAGRWVPVVYDIEPYCEKIFENPPTLKNCLSKNQNHINIRGESVCVSSVNGLFERGYLI